MPDDPDSNKALCEDAIAQLETAAKLAESGGNPLEHIEAALNMLRDMMFEEEIGE
jgi:hypothetical protein